jgi:5-(carboxyamino)imidazole ribonucleotide synthase
MLAMAAARLGYRTVVLEPQPDCPAAQVANRQIVAAYDDPDALTNWPRRCAVVTYEFENVPVGRRSGLPPRSPVPPPAALGVAQDRLVEKTFLNGIGIATAISSPSTAMPISTVALHAFGGSGVLKTRRLGYDGKGQRVFRNAGEEVASTACGHWAACR